MIAWSLPTRCLISEWVIPCINNLIWFNKSIRYFFLYHWYKNKRVKKFAKLIHIRLKIYHESIHIQYIVPSNWIAHFVSINDVRIENLVFIITKFVLNGNGLESGWHWVWCTISQYDRFWFKWMAFFQSHRAKTTTICQFHRVMCLMVNIVCIRIIRLPAIAVFTLGLLANVMRAILHAFAFTCPLKC